MNVLHCSSAFAWAYQFVAFVIFLSKAYPTALHTSGLFLNLLLLCQLLLCSAFHRAVVVNRLKHYARLLDYPEHEVMLSNGIGVVEMVGLSKHHLIVLLLLLLLEVSGRGGQVLVHSLYTTVSGVWWLPHVV